jgi:hypothetical protein
MVRIQIQLERAQHRQVRQRAARLGVSVSEVVRRCVNTALQSGGDEPASRVRRALAVSGKYAESGKSRRTARDHDDALADAFKS